MNTVFYTQADIIHVDGWTLISLTSEDFRDVRYVFIKITHVCSQFQVYTFQQQPITKALDMVGVSSLDNPPGPIKDCYTVMLDGRIMGYVSDSMAVNVEQKLRAIKVKGLYKV